VTGGTYVLIAIGFILILAGVMAIFIGDKQIPVRGGIVPETRKEIFPIGRTNTYSAVR
jgi:hypothetical protein